MIPTAQNVKTITDLRERALELLDQVNKTAEPVFVFHRSKPKAVIMSIEEFSKLKELIEDLEDSILARKLEKNIGKGKYFGLAELKKRHQL